MSAPMKFVDQFDDIGIGRADETQTLPDERSEWT
jgi:hypothetical protein